MIKMRNLSKSYNELDALKDVSINVKKGSIYGLVGSNGAGKTTLLKLLSGIYKQDNGEVTIDNKTIFENTEVKEKIIFVPDIPYFLPQYTIKAMAVYYSRIYASWSFERFDKLKNAFNLDINKRIHQLSKGMQRQVAFWLALSIMPDVMILDEPFDGLDPVMRQKIKNLIIQDVAEREMTVLISSHNLRELEDLCDHIGIIHRGSLLLERELDDLKSDVHKIQAAFNKPLNLTQLKNTKILFEENRGSIKLFIARGSKNDIIKQLNEFDPLILDILPLTLEEIFIYEMGDVGYEIKNIIL